MARGTSGEDCGKIRVQSGPECCHVGRDGCKTSRSRQESVFCGNEDGGAGCDKGKEPGVREGWEEGVAGDKAAAVKVDDCGMGTGLERLWEENLSIEGREAVSDIAD